MRELPVGTAYAVFTGIGATGAITLGIVHAGDPADPGRLLAVGLIVSGVLVSGVAFFATPEGGAIAEPNELLDRADAAARAAGPLAGAGRADPLAVHRGRELPW
jgi:hypothetical protein